METVAERITLSRTSEHETEHRLKARGTLFLWSVRLSLQHGISDTIDEAHQATQLGSQSVD